MTQSFEKRFQGVYRSRTGMICGVCKGMAQHFDFPVLWTRVIVVALTLFTGLWPLVLLYFLAAVLIRPEPILPIRNREDQEFYNSYVSSRSLALDRLKRTFDNLDRRIQRMETIITAREYDWDRRLNEQP